MPHRRSSRTTGKNRRRPDLSTAVHPLPAVSVTRASSYARVAAADPERIAAQHAANRAAAARDGHPVVAEYSDDGVSGLLLDRPGFRALLAAARDGAGPMRLYVTDGSRLGRFADPRAYDRLLSRLAERGMTVVARDAATAGLVLPLRR